MRIPFACAFKELLASYDKANYTSYLLNFFPARYKACRGMWKFSQLSTINFLEKITQNKVCVCQKLCILQAKVSHNGLVFRKARCLIILKHLINQNILLSIVSSLVRVNDIFDVTISN